MEPSSFDIQVRVHLTGSEAFDVSLIINAFDNLENALYSSDRRDVERAAQELGFSQVIRDAAFHYRTEKVC